MGKMDIPYMEKDGILYPLLTIPADMELSAVGKYGLLWLSYMEENHKGRFRTLTRLGCVNQTAHKVNEEAYEMLDLIIGQHMGKHPPVNPGSTMEMWKLREQAKTMAEETVLMDIMSVVNKVPVLDECHTYQQGLITAIDRIQKECIAKYGKEVPEYIINEVIETGDTKAIAKNKESIMDTINAGLKRYALEVEAKLRELKIDFDFTNVVYVGGGAGVMRRFGSCNGENVRYVTDVRANALGYQYLAQNLEV